MDADSTPPRPSRLREIFAAALDLPDESQRRAWLEQTCGSDLALLRQVQELLAAHRDQHAGPLDAVIQQLHFDETLAAPPTPAPPLNLEEHPVIGPYKLLQRLGEGGMGTVYMAQQTVPIRRKVAFKMIKPGMGTRDVIARFEAERQALALMEHPHIATVLDAGTTPDGRPYFVMELVNGHPITEYCCRHKVSLNDLLRLFIDVCRAVQHAHLKGIIHRDLKPSNVLITIYDGQPTVKIIDFGVAKALNQDLTEQTLFTQFACLIGTPVYMSPEQAELGRLDIDTRSDVYSLGVLLYELLTGTKPFAHETLTHAGFDEMRRIIREDNPPRPSTRLNTLSGSSDSTQSAAPPLGLRELSRSLRSDLDWVVMTALEKDRDRRYQSASALADDLQRFLDGLPVEACPPSPFYALSKLARRYKGPLAAATALVSLLVISLVIVSRLAFRASRAERDAVDAKLDVQLAAESKRRMLYDSDMLLASQAWRHDDVQEGAERLRRHIPAAGETDLRGFEWHYLSRQQSMPGREFAAGGPAQYDLAFAPDGQVFAVVGQDAMIRIYQLDSGALLHSIPTGQQETNGVTFTPDGTRVAVVGDDGTLRVFDVATRRELYSVTAHARRAFRVLATPDGDRFITCGQDRVARVWNAADGTPVETLAPHEYDLEYMVGSPTGLLALGDRGAVVRLWDSRQRQPVHELRSPRGDAVSGLAFAGDRFIAHGTVDGELYISDVRNGALVTRRRMPDSIQSLAFAPEGEWLIVGGRSGEIRMIPFEGGLWDLDASRTWPAHRGRVYAVAAAPDGRCVISAGDDGRVVEWQPWSSAAHQLVDCRNAVHAVDAIDADCLVVGATDCVDVYSRDGRHLRELISFPGDWEVAVARETRHVFGKVGALVAGWDATTGAELFRRRSAANETCFGIDVTPDGGTLAIFTRDDVGDFYMELLDVASQQCSDRHRVESASCSAVSPDGRWIAHDCGNSIQVFDLLHRRVERTWPAHAGTIRSLQISTDGRRLVSGSADRAVKVWSFPEGELLGAVLAHRTETLAVAVTSDGRRIATSGDDRALRLWDGDSLQLLWEYPPLTGTVHDLQFLTDDQRLAGLSGERYLMILDGSPVAPPGAQ